jgi:hypothetical protein
LKQGSEMARNCVHLSGRDVDDAIMRAYGVVKSKDPILSRLLRTCARYATSNLDEAEICRRCGLALSDAAAFSRGEEFQKLKKVVNRIRDELEKLVR